MEFLTPELIGALLSIILIDLTLGGDNAIVIGMVARTVPVPQQKKVILLGAAGAFIVRSLTTIIAVELLKVRVFYWQEVFFFYGWLTTF